jgi:Ca2+-binding EF-hand superfamily protein
LFSNNKAFIEFDDLKRIARELGETMSDDELKEMMYEANKVDREGTVERKDFIGILTKYSGQLC